MLLGQRTKAPLYAGNFYENCYSLKKNVCDTNKKIDLILVGDSQAGSLSGVVERISKDQKLSKLQFWLNGCPYLTTKVAQEIQDDASDNRKCVDFVNLVNQTLIELNPKVVVLANGTYAYRDFTSEKFLENLFEFKRKNNLQTKFLIVEKIPTLNKPLLFMANKLNRNSQSYFYNNFSADFSVDSKMNREALFLVPSEFLCNEHTCSISSKKKILYSDSGHLSTYGADLLRKPLQNKLSMILDK
jgi:hypothetical protein